MISQFRCIKSALLLAERVVINQQQTKAAASNMFRYNILNRNEVKRFETPFNENFLEVHLADLSVNPLGQLPWKPIHCVMPAKYRQFAEIIRNLTVYKDDVWIVSFPKAGTTWTQEMVWLIEHDLDYETATTVNLLERSVFLEISALVTNLQMPDSIARVENMARPRHIKTHLPLALLPKALWTTNPKIVYVARNPKDVTTSFMHHYKQLHGFNGSKQDYLDGILSDQIVYCPQMKHATEFWPLATRDNVFFLYFEDMKRNMPDVLEKICGFFGKSFTQKQLAQLQKHLSFDSMKDNSAANNQSLVTQLGEAMGIEQAEFRFMRKGQVGANKKELPEEFVIKLENYVKEQLEGTEFKYKE